MPRVALVLNPAARGAGAARLHVERACVGAGLEPPWVLRTTRADPGRGQAEEALAAGCHRVVVAGGDGTVREVAGVLARDAPATSAGEPPVLGVVPAGTANLAARGMGVPLAAPGRAARRAVSGPPRTVDLGQVQLRSSDGATRSLSFLVVVGVGHDARTLAELDPAAKARLGWLAYLTPGVRRLTSAARPVTVRLDGGQERTEQVWSVLAVNTARLPLRMQVVPGARMDDGLLHVVLVAPRHLADWGRVLRSGARVPLGRRSRPDLDHPALRHRHGRVLELGLPEAGPVQVDGDVVPDILGARIEVLPGALRVAGPTGARR